MSDSKKFSSVMFDLENKEGIVTPLCVEGVHDPDPLARASGIWISSAGSTMLPVGEFPLKQREDWVWLAVQSGGRLCGFHRQFFHESKGRRNNPALYTWK